MFEKPPELITIETIDALCDINGNPILPIVVEEKEVDVKPTPVVVVEDNIIPADVQPFSPADPFDDIVDEVKVTPSVEKPQIDDYGSNRKRIDNIKWL